MTARDRGWGAPRPYGHPDVVPLVVRGVDMPAGIHHRVHDIMWSLVDQFYERVAPPNEPYAWGHAYRYIDGTTVWSQHAWGLAVDIRNDLFPMFEDNMTAVQERACKRIGREHGCRWGGDYSSGIDQMHFEFTGTPVEADLIAANLGNDTGKRETTGEDMITRGDEGEIVTQWQQALQHYFWFQGVDALPEYGNDGVFGGETIEWTRRWQGEVGLPGGMVTPADWTVMGLSLHRRDDPAGAVDPGEPVRYDDYSLMDFAHANRADINQLLGRSVNVSVDENAIADALAPKLEVNKDVVASALREVLREGVNPQ